MRDIALIFTSAEELLGGGLRSVSAFLVFSLFGKKMQIPKTFTLRFSTTHNHLTLRQVQVNGDNAALD